MIGIVMATHLEAVPFVRGLKLRRAEKKPFRVYVGTGHVLVLSGIGKANAAMAVVYLAMKYGVVAVLNAGAAGALHGGFRVGDLRVVDRVVERDRPRLRDGGPRALNPDAIPGLACASLLTQDRPILDPAERSRASATADLVDMEGAAVVQACRQFGIPCYLAKVVTDTPEQSTSVHILLHIRLTRSALFDFCAGSVLSRLGEAARDA